MRNAARHKQSAFPYSLLSVLLRSPQQLQPQLNTVARKMLKHLLLPVEVYSERQRASPSCPLAPLAIGLALTATTLNANLPFYSRMIFERSYERRKKTHSVHIHTTSSVFSSLLYSWLLFLLQRRQHIIEGEGWGEGE